MAYHVSSVGIPLMPLDQMHPQQDNHASPQWEDEYDTANPFNWPVRKKWQVTLIACYVTLIVGLNSTSITSASDVINKAFRISDEHFPNSFWPVTAWNTGAAIAPMVILPLMENFGMRKEYLICYALFLVFVIPQALARNFATLITCRFIAGCCGGILQDVMDNIIADIWPDAQQRSLPVTFYVFSLLAGVTLGPVFGGAVMSNLDWRWIFYIQLIIYGVSAPIIFITFKETRSSVILSKRAKKEAGQSQSTSNPMSPSEFFSDALVRPAKLLCTEPVVFFFTLLSALSYGVVFVSTQSVTQVYTANYHWEEYQAGLVQAALVIGEIFGFLACILQNKYYAKVAEVNKDNPNSSVPEARLHLSVLGSFLGLTAGLFWYGWTSYPDLHWILPSIGLGLIGFGSVIVMQAIMMYITDCYAKYAGSASAAVCFGENIFAAFLPLATQSMYSNLGFRWASSLLGFVALVFSFAPIVLVIKGKAIRRRSPFMRQALLDT